MEKVKYEKPKLEDVNELEKMEQAQGGVICTALCKLVK